MSKLKLLLSLATSALLFISCSESNQTQEAMTHNQVVENKEQTELVNIGSAIAILYPTEGSEVNGQVVFKKTSDNKIEVTAEIYNLTPGKHGFHIHEYGDCSSPDGKSAGGHFFTDHNHHGALEQMETHVGDLGNLVADKDGVAKVHFTIDKLAFSGKNSIIGRGVIVHTGEDDLKTQPTGAAGGRVACGTIGISK
jgi:Cu-Zn family superoxide dismutase